METAIITLIDPHLRQSRIKKAVEIISMLFQVTSILEDHANSFSRREILLKSMDNLKCRPMETSKKLLLNLYHYLEQVKD